MDGGGRLLKSLGERFAPRRVARAAAELTAREPIVPTLTVDLPMSQNTAPQGLRRWLSGLSSLPRWSGMAGAAALIAASITGGVIAGGQYQTFTLHYGGLGDVAARVAGFGISEISVSGNKELTPSEVIGATGITAANSLPFLDVASVQERLKAVPLIASVSVRKLFPNKLAVTISERQPFGLWQKDGNVHLVSADGTVIDEMRDNRFMRLPHVVGAGANKRVTEYAEILDSVPEMKERVRAGTLVSERRWTLKLKNGVDVKLPETQPAQALHALARLDQDFNVLGKDVLSIDLRVPGRVAFRLTEDAARARAEIMDKKTQRKGKA